MGHVDVREGNYKLGMRDGLAEGWGWYLLFKGTTG